MFFYFFVIMLAGVSLTAWIQYWKIREKYTLRQGIFCAIVNVTVNLLLTAAAFYRCSDVWLYYRTPVCAQHFGIFGCAGVTVLFCACLLGIILRMMHGKIAHIYLPGIGRPLALLMCVLSGTYLLSSYLICNAADSIQITSFCRKTQYTQGQSSGEKRSGFAEITCTGTLPVSLEGLMLTAAEDGSDSSPLEPAILDGGQTLRIWLDDMPLDLSKEGGNLLRLVTADGYTVSSVRVPKLSFGECYSLVQEQWKVQPVPNEIQPEAPQLSHPGGIYDAEFSLTVSAQPGTTVYYTTDGSTPSEKSTVYTEPIRIYDPTDQPNRYRNISDVMMDPSKFQDPGNVDKAFVLRACAVDASGNTSSTVTATYFVGLPQYRDAALVSLTADPEVLFGDNGIYVTGLTYHRWKTFMEPVYELRYRICYNAMRILRRLHLGTQDFRNHLQYDFFPTNFCPRPNYLSRGKASEREANFEFYNFETSLSQPAGIRIQGGDATRETAIKRFSIRPRDIYSGSDYFQEPIFPGRISRNMVLRRNTNNALVGNLAQDRSVTAQQSMAVYFFLNGEYWTETYLMDEYSEHFIGQLFGIEPERLEVVQMGLPSRTAIGELPVLSDVQVENLLDFFKDLVAAHDLTREEAYDAISEALDMQSYLDFAAINFYVGNGDFGDRKNYVLWRTYLPDEQGNPDLRWHYALFDLDLMIYAKQPDRDDFYTFNPYVESSYSMPMNRQFLFSSLLKNARFRQQYALTLMDLMNTCFAPDAVSRVMEPLGLDIETHNNGYFLKRAPYAIDYTAEELGISNEVGQVRITSDIPAQITLNTLTLDGAEPWYGQYFTAYPVTVSIADSNFDHWEITTAGTTACTADNTVQVDVQKEGVQIHAVFR